MRPNRYMERNYVTGHGVNSNVTIQSGLRTCCAGRRKVIQERQGPKMTEQIGKVTLDLSFYPGEDFYCDGTVEDEILEIVKTCPPEDYQKKIEEKHSWPVFYHLSPQRQNIVSWLPMDKNTKVLEVGSGMGAVTGALAEKAGSVTCVDLSKKRSLINAYRNQKYDNVTIYVGNFNDIEPVLPCDYDYVLLIGVFEYGQSYIPTKTPYEDFLNINQKHVKKDGNLVIAIENKMGMKYWAGCAEDHLSQFFAGIEDYPDGGAVRTFTRGGLEKLLHKCGIPDYHFYYPYPDYKFTDTIYSDRRLPKVGELSKNLRNFDADRMLLFDEKNAFDMVIREGIFPMYSNSYLVMTGPPPETVYTKFSNDRAEIYAIRTDILEAGSRPGESCRGDKKRCVRKYPACPAAVEHVQNIYEYYKKLKKRFEGSGLFINDCHLIKDGYSLPYVQLEYLEGCTLEEMLDECLEEEDMDSFQRLFGEYLDKISYRAWQPVADYDLVFGNILVDKGGRWNLIDYEWTFEECVDTNALAFRALYCYQMGSGKRKKLVLEDWVKKLGIQEEAAKEYRARERRFQKAVTGNRVSVSDMRVLLGRRAIPWQGFFSDVENNKVQIFEDYGSGYKPEHSYYLYLSYLVGGRMRVCVPVKEAVKGIRIDPAEDSCLVRMLTARLNERQLPLEERAYLAMNGWELSGKKEKKPVFFFHTKDPNINIRLENVPRNGEEILEVEFEIERLSEETASALDANLKRRHWF